MPQTIVVPGEAEGWRQRQTEILEEAFGGHIPSIIRTTCCGDQETCDGWKTEWDGSTDGLDGLLGRKHGASIGASMDYVSLPHRDQDQETIAFDGRKTERDGSTDGLDGLVWTYTSYTSESCQEHGGLDLSREMFPTCPDLGRWPSEALARMAAGCFRAVMSMEVVVGTRPTMTPVIETRIAEYEVVPSPSRYPGMFSVLPTAFECTRVPVPVSVDGDLPVAAWWIDGAS